jgi:hypothetical protein
MRLPRRLDSLAVVLLTALSAAAGPPAVTVRFELNDAQVKGRALEGVQVSVRDAGGQRELASGRTDAGGRWTARLAPGSYQVSYRLEGYVPYTSSGTEIRDEGQLVTVSLSRLLEATESGGRDVRIILNWGSRPDQVRDADSHLACACAAAEGHVFYSQRVHDAAGHKVELDVDDTDWGGPETITVTSPAPGSYLYWVHDYRGSGPALGAADVVVRVVIGTEEAGEFRVFKGVTQRAWRPFKAIEVSPDGRPTVLRFTEDEIAEGADLAVPGHLQPPTAQPPASSSGSSGTAPMDGPGGLPRPVLVAFALAALILFVRALSAIRRINAARRRHGRRRPR